MELKSGGFSFLARDSEGNVWVWGQLDASFFGGQWDFASASKRVVKPTRLGMPVPIQKTRRVDLLRQRKSWLTGFVEQYRSTPHSAAG
jgi:SCF-associated factor 1